METDLTVSLDDEPVRFTPDGRIFVLDAIRALTLSDSPEVIWEEVKQGHPEIIKHSHNYSFRKGGSLPVLDSKGWEMMWALLIDHVVDHGRMQREQGK